MMLKLNFIIDIILMALHYLKIALLVHVDAIYFQLGCVSCQQIQYTNAIPTSKMSSDSKHLTLGSA